MTVQRTGRRPGDPDETRAAILLAARRTFADNGYDRATIRAIAAEAEVDPALVMHHFGDKRGLFVASHALPADPSTLFGLIAELPVEERGVALARAYLEIFASADSTVLSLIRSATAEPAAATMLREFIDGEVVPVAVALLVDPEDDGPLRMTLLVSHLMGVAVARNFIGVTPLVETSRDELVASIGPAIQFYIDGWDSVART